MKNINNLFNSKKKKYSLTYGALHLVELNDLATKDVLDFIWYLTEQTSFGRVAHREIDHNTRKFLDNFKFTLDKSGLYLDLSKIPEINYITLEKINYFKGRFSLGSGKYEDEFTKLINELNNISTNEDIKSFLKRHASYEYYDLKDLLSEDVKFESQLRIRKEKIKKEALKAVEALKCLDNRKFYIQDANINYDNIKLLVLYDLMKKDAKEIPIENIELYKNILKSLPEIELVIGKDNNGRTKKITTGMMRKYYFEMLKDLKPKLELSQVKNSFHIESRNHHQLLGYYSKIGLSDKEIESRRIKLREKLEVFNSLECISCKEGINSFDGYVAFEFEEGFIILEKFYADGEKTRAAYEEAAYVIKKEDFERVCYMTKTECIEAIEKGSLEAKRIFHDKHFKNNIYSLFNTSKKTL